MLFFLKMNDKAGKRTREPQLLLCLGAVLPVSRSTPASRFSSSMGGSFRKAGFPRCSRILLHSAPPPPCAGGASSSTGSLLLVSKHSKTLAPSQKPRRDLAPAARPFCPPRPPSSLRLGASASGPRRPCPSHPLLQSSSCYAHGLPPPPPGGLLLR